MRSPRERDDQMYHRQLQVQANLHVDIPNLVQRIDSRLIEGRLTAIEGRLTAIEAPFGAMKGRLDGIEYVLIGIQNYQAQAFNRRRLADVAQHVLPLQPLRKVRAGNGPGILGLAKVEPPQPLQVGTALTSPPFPGTVRDVCEMTLDQINELAIMMTTTLASSKATASMCVATSSFALSHASSRVFGRTDWFRCHGVLTIEKSDLSFVVYAGAFFCFVKKSAIVINRVLEL